MPENWTVLFGIAATVVGGVWTVFVYFHKRNERGSDKSNNRSIRSAGGIASGRDTVIHGNVSFKELPKGAVGLAVLGLIILAWAIANIGDKVTTYNLNQYSVDEAKLSGTPDERTFLSDSLAAFVSAGDGVVTDVEITALQGEWASKWRRTTTGWFEGTAKATVVGDELRIHYNDETGSYDLRAQFVDKGILFGRYQNLGVPADSTDWVGFVVSQDTIRGYYERGLWDFWRR
jgi:hypothetical protein